MSDLYRQDHLENSATESQRRLIGRGRGLAITSLVAAVIALLAARLTNTQYSGVESLAIDPQWTSTIVLYLLLWFLASAVMVISTVWLVLSLFPQYRSSLVTGITVAGSMIPAICALVLFGAACAVQIVYDEQVNMSWTHEYAPTAQKASLVASLVAVVILVLLLVAPERSERVRIAREDTRQVAQSKARTVIQSQESMGTYNPHTNSMAVAALVLGIVIAPLAIPVGHIARSQIKRTGEQGNGLALAGLILGYIFLSLIVLFLAAIVFSGG